MPWDCYSAIYYVMSSVSVVCFQLLFNPLIMLVFSV